MYGIALEGGGTRGAYHIGVLKAIFECGFEVGAICGTSIGAFNAAVVAQGDFDKLYNLWYNGDSTMAIDLDKKELKKVNQKKVDIDALKYWYGYVTKSISDGGIDTAKLRKLYESCIDEEKLRNSNMEYGLVTVSLTDKKPVYVYKEDIAKGKLIDYVLASCNLPVFKMEKLVDGKKYIDGGFYDNCPIQMLIDKKISDIFEVRTEAIGISRKINRKKLNIYTIVPSKELGSILFTDNDTMKRNIQMGYFDAIRVINGYLGKEYYIVPQDDDVIFERLTKISEENILNLAKLIRLTQVEQNIEPKKLLLSKVLPTLEQKMLKQDTSTYQKLIVALMEYIAHECEVPEYTLYSFEEFLAICKTKAKKLLKKEEDTLIKNNSRKLIFQFILYI